MNKVSLFGITMDNVTMDETLGRLREMLRGSGKHFVVTPNVDHLVRLHKDAEFRGIYKRASLVLADGMPVLWGSRLLGRPLKERVAGSDLMIPACRLAAETGARAYFLGSMPGVAEKAIAKLQKEFPNLQIAGHYSPPFGFEKNPEENRRIVSMINESRTDILFVALGAPKQEKWIDAHLKELNIKVGLCIGAGLDFIAGAVTRAPEWMRKTGLEWFWRLMSDPGRLWKRYLIEDMLFIKIFLAEWWRIAVRKAGPDE